MSGLNMPSKIESGETTVKDKWAVLKIMFYILIGALLIGLGIGMLLH